MKLSGIQSRVTMIALLPALILAVSLTVYHARSRMADIEQAVLAKGAAVAKHLAPGSEFGVVTANNQLLDSIVNTVLQDDDFVQITISDNEDQSIIDRSRPGRTASPSDWLDRVSAWLHPLFSTHPLVVPVRAPIYRIRIRIADDFAAVESEVAGPEIVGWIDIKLSLLDASRNQFIVLMESLLIVGAALLAATAAGRYVGAGVVNPVRAMTNAVRRITFGDLNARVKLRGSGELGQLEAGINQMAERVSISHGELQAGINKATADLKATLEELEQRNLELDEARRDAVRASDFKSQFLANVSHEIRTPMNAILGFTELLARSSHDPVQKEFLETILTSASSLLSLLNEILDLSKIESGRMQLEVIETDICKAITEVYQLFLPQAAQKDLEFLAQGPDPSLSHVLVDPLRLKQVLVNLVSNALKFTDDGYVLFRTRVLSVTNERLDIEFSVEDTGCGIAEDTQRKLFHAFSQGDMSTTRSHGGSGLGLHIASELVFMMGGEISVESAPGLGSRFSFNLSLQRDRSIDTVADEMDGNLPPVLLLNTYPPFLDTCRDHLRQAGFHVITIDDEDFDPNAKWLCVLDYWSPRIERDRARLHDPEEPGIDSRVKRIAWVSGPIDTTMRERQPGGYHAYVTRTPDVAQTRRSLLIALDQPPAADAHPGPQGSKRKHRQRGTHVLVVDDHPLNLKLVNSLLHGTGYEAQCIQRAPEALEIAKTRHFDAILLDIHMPHIDGFELTRELRNTDCACRDSVIIALTADAYAETAQQAQRVGMNDVLVKPVNQDSLLTMLDTWLEPDPSLRAIQRQNPSGSNEANPENALANEMRAALRKMLPLHREEITTAYERGDWVELKQQVHKLRGATSYCELPDLSAALKEFESLLSGDFSKASLDETFERCDLMIDEQIRISAESKNLQM